MRAVKKLPGDRICDTCGNVGFKENLKICFQCNTASEHVYAPLKSEIGNTASEHIYCMQNVGSVRSEPWRCEKCSASHGVHHDGKLNSKRKNLDISDITVSQFKKTKVHDQDDLSFNSPQSGEFDIDEMCHTGSKKPFPSEDGSLEKLHVGKQQVATKYLSRSSSFNRKEPSKVKPLSAEEVVQLTSGAVGRMSTSRRSFCSSANQSHVPSVRPISQRTHQSKSASSRPEENFHHRMKISFDSEVKRPHSNCMMTRENNDNHKEVRIQNDRIPGEKFPAVLHGKQIMKRSPSTDVLSPRCNTPTCSRSVSAAPYLYKTDGLRKRQADNILEPTKEEPLKNGDLIEACSPSQNTKLADSECLNSRDIADKKKKAASEEPTKEESLMKSDLIEVCLPTQHTKLVDLECFNSGMVDIGDKKKKTGEETFGKPHEAYNFKNARSVESGVANKALILHNMAAVNMPPSDSGDISYSETVLKETGFQDKSLPPSLAVHPQQKISNCLTAEVRWKGFFDILYLDSLKKFGMLAHCPRNFSIKVYDMAQQMPTELKLSVVPRPDVWPRAFQSDPPDSDDIGLYFVPSNLMRSQEDFFCFLERIDLGDFALRAWVGGVELLVFSSKQLPVDSQRILNGLYLWGVFRHVNPKKGIHHKDVPSSVHTVASQSVSSSHVNPKKGIHHKDVPSSVHTVASQSVSSSHVNPKKGIHHKDVPSSVHTVSSQSASSSQFNVLPVGNSKEVGTKVDMVIGVDTSIKELGVPGLTRPFSGSNVSFVASPADDSVQLKVPLEGDINEIDMKPDIVRTKIGLVDRPISRFDEPPGFRIPVSADATLTSKVASAVSQSIMNSQTNAPLESDVKELDMKVDIVKGVGIGTGIDLADKSMSSPDAPSGFTRPISVDLLSSSPSIASQHNSSSQLNSAADSDIKKVDTKINVVGRTKIGLLDRFVPSLCTPPGFTRPVSGDITSDVPVVVSKQNTDNQLNFSPECNSTEGDKEIDKRGAIEIGLLDRFIPSLRTPPGFSRPISVDMTSDAPIVVSKPNTDNQLNFSQECNSTEVNMEIDMVGGIDIGLLDKPIPRLDTSRGFSRPISDDDHEERPLVKFSLQKVRDISPTILPFFSRNSGLENQNNLFEINHGFPVLSNRHAITPETYNLLKNNEVPPTEGMLHLEPYSSGPDDLSMEKNEVHAKDEVCFKISDESDHARSLSSELPLPLPEEKKVFSSMEHHIDENAISSAKHDSISTSSFEKKSGTGLFDSLRAKPQNSLENSLYEGFTYKETKESEEIADQVTDYEIPFPSSEEQVLFCRTALPLFPAAAEFRSGSVSVNEVNEQDVQLNGRKTDPQISPDLSLSRPHYVQDGNIWISAASHEKLKKDNCGHSLKLSF